MTATATTSKTDELLQRLTEGVEKLTSSEEWVRYLDVQRRFHRYSFGNCLLIALQRPDATRVAGFHRWLELRRHVRRGEKGIAILAPIVHRLKVEDEATGEERTIQSAPRAFRVVHVFDVSQTDGDDLPEIPCSRLEGEGWSRPHLLDAKGSDHRLCGLLDAMSRATDRIGISAPRGQVAK